MLFDVTKVKYQLCLQCVTLEFLGIQAISRVYWFHSLQPWPNISINQSTKFCVHLHIQCLHISNAYLKYLLYWLLASIFKNTLIFFGGVRDLGISRLRLLFVSRLLDLRAIERRKSPQHYFTFVVDIQQPRQVFDTPRSNIQQLGQQLTYVQLISSASGWDVNASSRS